MGLGLKNWSGNLKYQARKLHEAASISEAPDSNMMSFDAPFES